MKTNVSKIRRDLVWHFHVGKVVNAVRHVVLPQQLIYLRLKPTFIAKLENVLVLHWQTLQKLRQSLEIHFPAWRQLKKYRTELLLEPLRHQKELLRRTFRVFQLFHVRDEAAGLDRETKIVRRRFAPGVKCLCGWQAIEAVIDLDGIEVARVELKQVRARGIGRIKDAAQPVFVVPPGSADEDLHC